MEEETRTNPSKESPLSIFMLNLPDVIASSVLPIELHLDKEPKEHTVRLMKTLGVKIVVHDK